MRLFGRLLECLSIILLFVGSVNANVILETRSNTDDIVIPVFDTSLGTLNSVNLTVKLLSGATDLAGSHDHGGTTLTSTTAIYTELVGGFSETWSTFSDGIHNAYVNTPSYVSSGLNLGSFFIQTNPGGLHYHNASLKYAGLTQVAESTWLVKANVTTDIVAPHSLSYGDEVRSYPTFVGSAMDPFLGPTDVVIPAGPLMTSSASHEHELSSFSVGMYASYGYLTVYFPSWTLPIRWDVHTVDPRFTTTAVFDYTPATVVPEPTTLIIWSLLGGLALTMWRRR